MRDVRKASGLASEMQLQGQEQRCSRDQALRSASPDGPDAGKASSLGPISSQLLTLRTPPLMARRAEVLAEQEGAARRSCCPCEPLQAAADLSVVIG